MLRSDPGSPTGLPMTSTVPSVAGWCGRRPAINRSTVDLPQPDGPRMQMNSPLSGMLGTQKVTSRITTRLPNRLVTLRNSTTFSVTSFLRRAIGEQAALEEEQQAIDAVGEQPDDHEDQNDVLRESATLTRHQQVAEAVLRVDQLGEHDVAKRQAEEMAQAAVDLRQRQRDEHLVDDLERGRAERLRGFHVALGH